MSTQSHKTSSVNPFETYLQVAQRERDQQSALDASVCRRFAGFVGFVGFVVVVESYCVYFC